MNTTPGLRPLLYRWFVQFNPLFTASALCVLAGVLLLSRALGSGSEAGLTAIVDLYQWLLIGSAALLYRRLLERRPAVILGIIALVFAMDPTLQVSALAGNAALPAVLVWLASFAAKVRALAWGFQLRTNASARRLPVAAAALVAALPVVRLAGVDDVLMSRGLALVVFFVIALAIARPPRVSSAVALDDEGQRMFARLMRAALGIVVVGVALQAVNACLAIGAVGLAPAGVAALFAVALATRSEQTLWCLVVCGLVVGSATDAWIVALPLAAAVLLVRARHHAPRVAVVGVLCATATLYWSDPAVWTGLARLGLAAATTVPLIGLLARRRAWSALPPLVAMHAPTLARLGGALADLAPSTSLGWGALLTVAGFFLLPAGLVAHRRLSQALATLTRDAERASAEAATDGPSTSAQALASGAT